MATRQAPSSMTVRWHRADRDTDEGLIRHINEVIPGPVRTGRLCARCGGDDHGRPWGKVGQREVSVSLSRSGSHLVTAVATTGSVGVDLESIDDIVSRWQPQLVLAPRERATTADEKAWMWAAKEAVLKAYGTGLDSPMIGIRVAAENVHRLDAPEGYVAALAWIGT